MNIVHNYSMDTGFEIFKFLVVGDLIFVLGQQDGFSECLVIQKGDSKSTRKVRLSKNQLTFDDFIHPKAYVNKLLFSGYDSDESGCL